MTVTALKFSPDYPAPGQKVTVIPVGNATGDLRFYLLSAPPSSSLDTLATYEADGKELAEIRLQLKANGQAEFTPDVPGRYKVIVRDVTVYNFIPSYGGEVPASGEPAKADNEEGSFFVGLVETAQVSDVPSGGQSIVVYDTVSRAIGLGQDTATIRIKCNTGGALSSERVSDPVTLTTPMTPRAAIAIYDPLVLQVLAAINDDTASYTTGYPTLLLWIVNAFNEHIGLQQWKVHTNADATNTLTFTTDVSATAASLQARLDDISGKFNAHRILTAGPVHHAADNVHVTTTFTITSDTDAENAVRYYQHLLTRILNHAAAYDYHDHSTETSVVDGYFSLCAEPPSTVAEVAQAVNGAINTRWEGYGLTALYENHRQRELVSAHYGTGVGPDATNTVLFLGDTLQGLIATANATADALARHIKNLDSDGAEAATPYHYTDAKKSRIPVLRAHDARSLALCIEELWLCMESHLWTAGPPSGYTTATTAGSRGQHGDRVMGGAMLYEEDLPPFMVRLQKAYDFALGPEATEPAEMVAFAVNLRRHVGFT